ncbi:Zuotin [Exophiala xenobiotica]|uniref:Zuotin n=1 Tax=Vermiconidia calcicola TaxID=1690605 RepID=A0AAV9PSZ0_9PEZI|nr:Zuotin [Exophiala xenobiotica]KAK5528701.1 Zuotin [Vermiconidia calcicola]KAK5546125.1 Zuotin [Chaetothyriales sp. CCFEE 6169]KAK5192328.1 Zuotin [Exophiala xenobiotica]KAK5207658.1 Zuotin [Exophiala xenobiotica]
MQISLVRKAQAKGRLYFTTRTARSTFPLTIRQSLYAMEALEEFAKERGWTVEQTIRALIEANPDITETVSSLADPDDLEVVEAFSTEMADGEIIPPPPADWKGESDANPNFRALSSLSPPVNRKIEPYGASFLAYARRKRHGRTFSEDDRIQAAAKAKRVEDDDDGEISEPEDPMMLARDAKDWRGQDHYAVLGLSKYRFKATDEQIKKAHRKKVLKHHPDKKAATGQEEGDSFFKCIQKAHEILTDPVRRRQFDSVDEAADVEPPSKKDITKPSAFYKKWNAVFESEGRFSNKQPVPKIGDDNSTKEEVEEFYDFWYNFDSWRTFEYLDEDVPDDNEGRDHKRHIEKKNANARKKRKSEDIARLRKLVDDCLAMDERIKKFRQQASAQKNKKKFEKEAAAKKEAEDKAKAKAEAERAQKEEEERLKVEREAGKKEKQKAKDAVKKNKRVVKASVKDVNYFAATQPSSQEVDAVLDDVDKILANVDPDELAQLVSQLNIAGKDGAKVKVAFSETSGALVGAGKLKESDLKVFK